MSRAIRPLFLAAAIFGVASVPHAAGRAIVFNGMGLIDYSKPPDWKVGSWVQYRWKGQSVKGEREHYLVTIVIAGEERFWGEDCFWVETLMEDLDDQGRRTSARGTASMISYAIFEDSAASSRVGFYQRKAVMEGDPHGNPEQSLVTRPSSSLTERRRKWRPPIEFVSEGEDTIITPKGTFATHVQAWRDTNGTRREVGDSTITQWVRDARVDHMTAKVPITHLACEDFTREVERTAWKIGYSQQGTQVLQDRFEGSLRVVDFGEGMKPQVIPLSAQKSIPGRRPVTAVKKSGSRKS